MDQVDLPVAAGSVEEVIGDLHDASSKCRRETRIHGRRDELAHPCVAGWVGEAEPVGDMLPERSVAVVQRALEARHVDRNAVVCQTGLQDGRHHVFVPRDDPCSECRAPVHWILGLQASQQRVRVGQLALAESRVVVLESHG